MLNAIAIFGLVYSTINWLLFAWSALASHAPTPSTKGQASDRHLLDPDQLVTATGSLATAFKSAGASATAAAMSLVGLVVAAVAAGVGKL